jgi:hypothetical protein
VDCAHLAAARSRSAAPPPSPNPTAARNQPEDEPGHRDATPARKARPSRAGSRLRSPRGSSEFSAGIRRNSVAIRRNNWTEGRPSMRWGYLQKGLSGWFGAAGASPGKRATSAAFRSCWWVRLVGAPHRTDHASPRTLGAGVCQRACVSHVQDCCSLIKQKRV